MKRDREIVKQYSFSEKVRFLLYKALQNLIDRIPRSIPLSYHFFYQAFESGARVRKIGKKNVIDFDINKRNASIILRRGTSDIKVFNDVFWLHGYKELVDLAHTFHINVKSIIDAGANIGLTTIYFKSYFPESTIICLEPFSENYDILKENIGLNSYSDVYPGKKGLWGKTTFLRKKNNFRDNEPWSFSLEETSDRNEALFEAISIIDLMNENQIQELDILKIDIEGGEASVFDKNHYPDRWLDKVKLMAIEIHDEFNCRENIEALLFEKNFELSHCGELTICVNRNLVK